MKHLTGLMIVCLAAVWPLSASAEPGLSMKENVVEAGRVYQGQIASGVVEVANQGDAELIIKRVSPG